MNDLSDLARANIRMARELDRLDSRQRIAMRVLAVALLCIAVLLFLAYRDHTKRTSFSPVPTVNQSSNQLRAVKPAVPLSDIMEPAANGVWHRFIASGYSHGCVMPSSGVEHGRRDLTASGAEAVPNWSVTTSAEFPFGTVLEASFTGFRTSVIVHDRGRAITKGRMDVFLESCPDARQFGRQVVWVREIRRPLGAL